MVFEGFMNEAFPSTMQQPELKAKRLLKLTAREFRARSLKLQTNVKQKISKIEKLM